MGLHHHHSHAAASDQGAAISGATARHARDWLHPPKSSHSISSPKSFDIIMHIERYDSIRFILQHFFC
jgi:hypothetical protein